MTITLAQSLAWDAVSGAQQYKVELLDSTGAVVKTVIKQAPATAVPAPELFAGLSAGPTYRARVRAEAGSFAGDWTSLLELVLEALGVPGNPRVQ